ncbi:unnamed protein product [Alternaria alternata]
MDARRTARPVSLNNDGGRIAIQAGEYHVYGNNIVNEAEDVELRKLPNAVEAPFNTYSKRYEPVCLPRTRTALLKKIHNWIDGQDGRCLFWLSGLAGTGKSTIARTVARRCYDQGNLGGSFFFSKGGGDVGHVRKFATSIAIQLARSYPAIRQHVCRTIRQNEGISDLSLSDQWQHLVLRPLSALHHLSDTSSLVLVVDALDECDNNADIEEIIRLLARVQQLSRPRLRILLTSRPEVAIRHGLHDVSDTLHECFLLHHIELLVVNADIELFLKHKFAITAREQRLPAHWPGTEAIATMAQRANGLFIWAATANRFIQQGRRFASIQKKREEQCKKLRYVLGILVILKEPLTAKALDELLGIAEEGIESIVEDLHAIIDIPGDGSRPIRLHHPSLRDFLLNKRRCTDTRFWIDEAQIHTALSSRCIALMTGFFKQTGGTDAVTAVQNVGVLCSELEKRGKEMMNKARNSVEFYTANLAELENDMRDPKVAERGLTTTKSYKRLEYEGLEPLRKIFSNLVSEFQGILEGPEALRSIPSHDAESPYSVELRYAVYNWARHLKQSGRKPIDHGEAHAFVSEYFWAWCSMITSWLQFWAWMTNIKCVQDCVSEEVAPLFAAFLQGKDVAICIQGLKGVGTAIIEINRLINDVRNMLVAVGIDV